MLTIDGAYTPPTPSSYKTVLPVGVDAKRNANFDMIIKYVKRKRKYEAMWNYMTASDLSALLGYVSLRNFTLLSPDTYTGTTYTGTFYIGDPTAEALDYYESTMRWVNVRINFIEV